MNDAQEYGGNPPDEGTHVFCFLQECPLSEWPTQREVRQSLQDEGLDPWLWGPYADAWTFARGHF